MRGLFFGGTLAGVLLGFGLGLAIAWTFLPNPFSGAKPADLRLDLKDDYLIMIASSYSLDGDMARALVRLDSLNIAQPAAQVSELAKGESLPLFRETLNRLAVDLRQSSIALARPTFTPRPTKTRRQTRSEPSAMPASTAAPPSPFPTLPAMTTAGQTSPPPTFAPTPDAPFFFIQSKLTLNCLDTRGRGLIEVETRDSEGRPLPAIGVVVEGTALEEVFYTGLKPERGMGYADLEVSKGTYSLQLIEGARSRVIDNLRVDDEPNECTSERPEVRGWKILFQRSE